MVDDDMLTNMMGLNLEADREAFIETREKEDNEPTISITVNKLTTNPTKLYEQFACSKQWKDNFKRLEPLSFTTPKKEGHVRFVCISDTHTKHKSIALPEGDVLLHAGDFTFDGSEREVNEFCVYLQTIKSSFQHIVVIAGNHELCLDGNTMKSGGFSKATRKENKDELTGRFKEMLNQHCIYLQDEGIELFGLKIYGSPWQPWHRGWAFNISRGEKILQIWNQIPDDTDILLCHGPPLGHGDLTKHNKRAGCAELLATIQERVKPKVNVFGHIHEGYGVTTDGTTMFINASICNLRYLACNKPIIFDLPVGDSTGCSSQFTKPCTLS